MSYSLDLRKKVINYIEGGGKITEASKIFKIGRATIYRWLSSQDLKATQVKHRRRKLDTQALEKDVKENPDSFLVERAKKFGVHPSAIFSALKKMKITRKKKELRYRERNREARIKYYRELRELIKIYGSKSLVFIDESGFEEIQACLYGWSKIGKKILGERLRKRVSKENLVAGSRKKEKDLMAPMVFIGSLNAEGFSGWLLKYLLPSLKIPERLNYGQFTNSEKGGDSRISGSNKSSSLVFTDILSRSQ